MLGGVLYLAGSNIGSGWVLILVTLLAAATGHDVVAVWRAARRAHVSAEARVDGAVAVRVTGIGPVCRGRWSAPIDGTRHLVGSESATVHPAAGPGHLGALAVVVDVGGPLNLAVAQRTVEAAVDVLVPPTVLPADHRLGLLRTAAQAREAADGARIGGEVTGVREYSAGDPPRQVHWRSSARRGDLVVREQAPTSGHRIGIALAGGPWNPTALVLATTVIASLGAAADRAGEAMVLDADGHIRRWTSAAMADLAHLPPLRGTTPRPLRPPEDEGHEAVLEPDGVGIRIGMARLATLEAVTAWLVAG